MDVHVLVPINFNLGKLDVIIFWKFALILNEKTYNI